MEGSEDGVSYICEDLRAFKDLQLIPNVAADAVALYILHKARMQHRCVARPLVLYLTRATFAAGDQGGRGRGQNAA
jgi:hypothetical protein